MHQALTHLTPEELADKVHALLEDWPSTTLSPIGLCRAHDLTLVQISAIRQLPMFTEILDHITEIQDHRRPHIEQRARDLALDRLCYLAHQTPTSAAACKEIRLATKAILDLVAPTPDSPGDTARRAVPSEPPSQQAPSVSEGVNNKPETSAQGSQTATPPTKPTDAPRTPEECPKVATGQATQPVAQPVEKPTPNPLPPERRRKPEAPSNTPPLPTSPLSDLCVTSAPLRTSYPPPDP